MCVVCGVWCGCGCGCGCGFAYLFSGKTRIGDKGRAGKGNVMLAGVKGEQANRRD